MKISRLLLLFLAVISISCSNNELVKISLMEYNRNTTLYGENMFEEMQENGIYISRSGGSYLLVDSLKNNQFESKNTIHIAFFDSSYIGIFTGVRTIDDGLKYFFIPTYTDFKVLDVQSFETVFEQRIYARGSQMLRSNNKLYIKYGKYPDFRFGYFDFNPN